MRSIWSKLAEEDKIIALNEINIDEPPKSSQVKKILSDIGASKALVVLSKNNEQLNKASKNLKECDVLTINSMNPSVLINADKVVVTSETINSLTEVLS
jgi:Ribosomal protein L4